MKSLDSQQQCFINCSHCPALVSTCDIRPLLLWLWCCIQHRIFRCSLWGCGWDLLQCKWPLYNVDYNVALSINKSILGINYSHVPIVLTTSCNVWVSTVQWSPLPMPGLTSVNCLNQGLKCMQTYISVGPETSGCSRQVVPCCIIYGIDKTIRYRITTVDYSYNANASDDVTHVQLKRQCKWRRNTGVTSSLALAF